MTATRSELQAWLDAYDTPDAPDAQTLADFLGIELAPEPATPVGQRRRSPDGVEVIKTDIDPARPWRRCQGKTSLYWFTDAEVAGWEVITDAPEAPGDVLNAVAQRIAADVCPCDDSICVGTGDRLARILADAGLLVGTTAEAPRCDREHLPEGCVPINLNGWASDELRAELARRGESS